MRTIGRLLGSTIRDIKMNFGRFLLTSVVLWFVVISNVNVSDSMAQDWFTCFMIFAGLALIFGSMAFRGFLIGRGSLNVLNRLNN